MFHRGMSTSSLGRVRSALLYPGPQTGNDPKANCATIARYKETHGSVTPPHFDRRSWFGLGWLAKSASRRVVAVDLPDGVAENKAEATADKDATADPKGR